MSSRVTKIDLDKFCPKKTKEAVNHPDHYNSGSIETIDAIEDWGFGQGFNLGNAIKYISRANHKNDCVEDLKKANWYLNREIQRLEKLKSNSVEVITAGPSLNTETEIVAVLDANRTDTKKYNQVDTECTLDNVDDDCTDIRVPNNALGKGYQFPKLTPEMLDELNDWYKRHNNGKCSCSYKGAIGGSVTFSVTPTSIGDFVTAMCPLCSEEFNVGEEL